MKHRNIISLCILLSLLITLLCGCPANSDTQDPSTEATEGSVSLDQGTGDPTEENTQPSQGATDSTQDTTDPSDQPTESTESTESTAE